MSAILVVMAVRRTSLGDIDRGWWRHIGRDRWDCDVDIEPVSRGKEEQCGEHGNQCFHENLLVCAKFRRNFMIYVRLYMKKDIKSISRAIFPGDY
jgi:hypothetical protein